MNDRDCNKEGTEASERVERNRPATNKWNSTLLKQSFKMVTYCAQILVVLTMRRRILLSSSRIYVVVRRIDRTPRLKS